MRNNPLRKTVEQIEASYSYYIKQKLNKIYAMSKLDNVSLDAMKKNIKNYVWKAAYSYKQNGTICYTRKQEFLDNVDGMTSKEDLCKYCYRVVYKAEDTIAR